MATVGCPFLETRRGVVAERPKLCELMDIYLCTVGLWVHEKNTHVEKNPAAAGSVLTRPALESLADCRLV